MKKYLMITTAAALVAASQSANAGGLFGDGGLIRGTVGGFLDKHVEKPITTPLAKGAERTAKKMIDTTEKTAKLALAASSLKALEDTLIEGKSLELSLKESLRDIKAGSVAIANSLSITNDLQNAIVEVTTNTLGKEAGRTLGYIYLPNQIASAIPGAVTQAAISGSEGADNLDNAVGIPLAAALMQAKDYYEPKAKPLPNNIKKLLSYTFTEAHLANVRYVVDSTGGNIAGLINGIKDQLGDIHDGNHAVAIDNIIVFAKEPKGADDLFFWAHEVQHTVQYAQKGIDGFATEYTQNYKAIEHDANMVAEVAVRNASAVTEKAVADAEEAVRKAREMLDALNS